MAGYFFFNFKPGGRTVFSQWGQCHEAFLDRGHPETLPVYPCLMGLINEYDLLNNIDD